MALNGMSSDPDNGVNSLDLILMRLRRDQSVWYFSLLNEDRYVWKYNGTPMETLHLSAWLRMLI